MIDAEGYRSMTQGGQRRVAALGRLAAVAQAAFFTASLVAAPLVHPWACTGACAGAAGVDVRSGPAHGGPAENAPPCHGGGGPRAKHRRCECTDDCCSLWAQFVSPPVVDDPAPASLVVARALPSPPDESGRAPAARLLPFPTGPPSDA
jgi:hypothetical protein